MDPIDPENPIYLFESLLGQGSDAALATVISGNSEWIGKKILLKNKSETIKYNGYADFIQPIVDDLYQLLENRKSGIRTYEFNGEEFDVFMEIIQPPIQLMIFGGGFDARSLNKLAKNLGWTVNVTDECVAHIAPVFFPGADNLSLCDRKFVDKEFKISHNSACVLMSHNYEYDRDVLRKLIKSDVPYIGILGPKKRFEKMLDDFNTLGLKLSESVLNRIHAPIGVDIGAETPDEIAVSIIAEIMGRFSQRNAGYLRNRKDPIHLHRDLFEEVILNPHKF